jgi:hypothetical protein
MIKGFIYFFTLSLSGAMPAFANSCLEESEWKSCLYMVRWSAIYSDGENLYIQSPNSIGVYVFSKSKVYRVKTHEKTGKFRFLGDKSEALFGFSGFSIIRAGALGDGLYFSAIPFINEDFSILGDQIVYLDSDGVIYSYDMNSKQSREISVSELGSDRIREVFCSDDACYSVAADAVYASSNIKDWAHFADLDEGMSKDGVGDTLYGGGQLARYFWGEKIVWVYDGGGWKDLWLDFRIVDAVWDGEKFVFLGSGGQIAFVEGGGVLDGYIINADGVMKGAGGLHYDGKSYFIVGFSGEKKSHAEESGGRNHLFYVLESEDGKEWKNISDGLNDRYIEAIQGGSLIGVSCQKDADCVVGK